MKTGTWNIERVGAQGTFGKASEVLFQKIDRSKGYVMHIVKVSNHMAINADQILRVDYYPTDLADSGTTKIAVRFIGGEEIEFSGEDADRLWRTLTGQGPAEGRFDMTED